MTIVLKLGGSLLTLPDLADKLRSVFNQRSGRNCLIVPGGGSAADIVRNWSQLHGLCDESAHWLAISSLDFNGQLLRTVLGLEPVNSRGEANAAWSKMPQPLVLNMTRFATDEEAIAGWVTKPLAPDERLPHSWNVTSDSLAAWTAIRWPADELVLIKSARMPAGLGASEAASNGLVDSYFPRLAPLVPRISWCNLRASNVNIEPWLTANCEQSLKSSADSATNDR